MNDPLLPQDPRTPDDPVEVALTAALANLSSREIRPSMVDVQHRAHRRQRRQAAAMVGALAVVVLGGAGVLALRHDHTPLAITAGDGTQFPATTIACVEVVPTTAPAIPGDSTTTTYPLTLPTLPPGVSTTLDPTGIPSPGQDTLPFAGNPCSAPNQQWRCQGPLSTTADGWTYYTYCEALYGNLPPTTTSTFDPALYPTTAAYDPRFPPVSTIAFLDTTTTGVVLPTSTP
jgi:hypothetical protein